MLINKGRAMSREDVVKGLEQTICALVGPTGAVANVDALRAAIAYMTPTTVEIEAARDYLGNLQGDWPKGRDIDALNTLDRALDALAREPGLEALLDYERKVLIEAQHEGRQATMQQRDRAVAAEARIAALEAQVAEGRRIVFGPAHDRISALEAREAATESTLHRKNVRIAMLEARLARVREIASAARKSIGRVAIGTEGTAAIYAICNALDAALAAVLKETP